MEYWTVTVGHGGKGWSTSRGPGQLPRSSSWRAPSAKLLLGGVYWRAGALLSYTGEELDLEGAHDNVQGACVPGELP